MNITSYVLKLTLILILGFLFTVLYGFLNNNYTFAACPPGYNSISYGPDEFCVNDAQPIPPCLPGDEETVVGQTILCTTPEVGPQPPGPGAPPGQTCSMAVLFGPSPPVVGQHINIVTPKPDDGTYSPGSDRPTNYYFEIDNSTQNHYFSESGDVWTATFGPLAEGSHYLTFFKRTAASQEIQCGQQTFSVNPSLSLDDCAGYDFNGNGTFTDEAGDTERHYNQPLTDDNRRYDIDGNGIINAADKNIFLRCEALLPTGHNPCRGGICRTALGNIPTDITGFAGRVLEIAIGLAGGIALILLVFGSIRVLTSSGDQQRLSAGRDTIIAAIAGLLFLIFSVLILKAIGLAIFGSGIPFT